MKLVLKITTPEDSLSLTLQEDLDRLSQWCHANGMDLNVLKCKVIKFHKSRNFNNFAYHINEIPLGCVDLMNDLVLLTSNLDFTTHINNTINKALCTLGFGFSNINAIRTLYYSYVRSHLGHAACVLIMHAIKIELKLFKENSVDTLTSNFTTIMNFATLIHVHHYI